jgi:hypothetical protein
MCGCNVEEKKSRTLQRENFEGPATYCVYLTLRSQCYCGSQLLCRRFNSTAFARDEGERAELGEGAHGLVCDMGKRPPGTRGRANRRAAQTHSVIRGLIERYEIHQDKT